MNKLPPDVDQGTFAEILVQLVFLKYGIQAAPPIKDSGNDLIAIAGEEFRAVQVKSSENEVIKFNKSDLPDLYHILALVQLDPEESGPNLSLDRCRIFLLPENEVSKGYWKVEELAKSGYEICSSLVDTLFDRPVAAEAA